LPAREVLAFDRAVAVDNQHAINASTTIGATR
jgi:hypothetical protein